MSTESLCGLLLLCRMQLTLAKPGVIDVVASRMTNSRNVIRERGSIEFERKPDGKILLFFSGMSEVPQENKEVQSNHSEVVDAK